MEQSVQTIEMLQKENANYRLRPAAAELTDLNAVVALADQILRTNEPLDILILNAGNATFIRRLPFNFMPFAFRCCMD